MRVESRDGTEHLVFSSPILSSAVLDELASSLRSLGAVSDPPPLVLRSDHSAVFLAGADLREIAALDPESCVWYAESGRSVVDLLAHHPSPTVAAVHGSCSGGGFDIAMACDTIVASDRATFDHPGARRGLVTGWSGTVEAPGIVGGSASRAIMIEGRRLDCRSALHLGLVDRICADPVRGAVERAHEIARLHPSRMRLWRLLRERRFVDRFRASVIHKL